MEAILGAFLDDILQKMDASHLGQCELDGDHCFILFFALTSISTVE